MLQAFDNGAGAGRDGARAQWMAALARAPVALLEPALDAHAHAEPQWLRAPETGLVMVQGRAGGTGERFNLGEITVTRCALRLPGTPAVGVAYVMGRSHRHAQLAAVADALLQDPAQHAVLQHRLLAPAYQYLDTLRAQRNARAQSTRVEFFTVAREQTDGSDDDNGLAEATS